MWKRVGLGVAAFLLGIAFAVLVREASSPDGAVRTDVGGPPAIRNVVDRALAPDPLADHAAAAPPVEAPERAEVRGGPCAYGKIVDAEDGAGIEGVAITFWSGGVAFGQRAATIASGPDGLFVLPLPDRTTAGEVLIAGERRTTLNLRLPAPRGTRCGLGTIPLGVALPIAGTFALRGGGGPLADAAVLLVGGARADVFAPALGEALARTDDDGRFSFAAVPRSSPLLQVLAVGAGQIGWAALEPVPSGQDPLPLRIEAAEVGALAVQLIGPDEAQAKSALRVAARPRFDPLVPGAAERDWTHEPPSGSFDELSAPPWESRFVRDAVPNATVEFPGLPVGGAEGQALYDVGVRGPSGETLWLEAVQIAPGRTTAVAFDVRGLFERDLRVRAVDRSGTPIAGARAEQIDGEGRSLRALGTTDAAGEVTLGDVLEADEPVLIEFRADGYVACRYALSRRSGRVEDPADSDLHPSWPGVPEGACEAPVAVLLRAAPVGGVVVDQFGAPVENARLQGTTNVQPPIEALYGTGTDAGGSGPVWWIRRATTAEAITDRAGRFCIDGTEEGDVQLAVDAKGGRDAWEGALPLRLWAAGGARDLCIVLQRRAREAELVLTIVDPGGPTAASLSCSLFAADASAATGFDFGGSMTRTPSGFTGRAAAGAWIASVLAGDGRRARARFDVAATDILVERTATLEHYGTLRGTVANLPAGAEVTVMLAPCDGSGVDSALDADGDVSCAADAAGGFSFLRVLPGEVDLTAIGPGVAGRARAVVRAGAECAATVPCGPSGVLRFEARPGEGEGQTNFEIRGAGMPWRAADRWLAPLQQPRSIRADVPPGRARWRVVEKRYQHDAAGRGTRVLGVGEVEVAAGAEVVVGGF